jgi:hypothetical protein
MRLHRHIGRQRFRVHREAVILRGDFHLAGFQIFHRLVAATMAELELERFSAECLTKDLVAEADAKNRDARVEQRLHFT